MKNFFRVVSVASLVIALLFPVVPTGMQAKPAQRKNIAYGGTLNYCVSPFYDHDQYNWLAFRNTCSQTIHLTWIFGNERGTGSSSNVRSQDKSNTGYSAEEVRRKGGYTLYVCPQDYVPVNNNAEMIAGGGSHPYMCREL